jgi:hypothetical protein
VPAVGSGWRLVPTIDPATGQIAITLSSTTPIAQPLGGSLVTIDFHQIPGASGPASIALVASVSPNGQCFATELADAQGSFTLTPAPTNALAGRIEGTAILAATPSTPPVSGVVFSTETFNVTVAQPQSIGSLAGTDRTAVEPDASEQVDTSRVTEPVHIPVNTAVIAAAANTATAASLLAAALLNGPAFQVSSVLAINMPMAAGQSLAAQVFQAWGRGGYPSNPALLNTVVADQWLVSLSTDRPEYLNSHVEWQDAAGSAASPEQSRQREVNVNPILGTSTVKPGAADANGVDRFFAQGEEDADWSLGDE